SVQLTKADSRESVANAASNLRLPPGLTGARAARADAVGEAIVSAHGSRGRITPPVLAYGMFRITGIEDGGLGPVRFADHEQTHFARGVIQEAVTDTRAGGKSDRIARTQRGQLAIEPHIRCARNHIPELLLSALGVRIRCAAPRQQALMMDPEPREPKVPAEPRADAHELVVAIVVRIVRLLDLCPVHDARRSVR